MAPLYLLALILRHSGFNDCDYVITFAPWREDKSD